MRRANRMRMMGVIVGCAALAGGSSASAADWPQWRGLNRDAHVVDFTPPQAWPKEMTPVWKRSVGVGVATPALVGDKLYVFSRQGNDEVTSCLEAGSGKPVWEDKYAATVTVGGAAGSFPGPRSSPAVAEGKVVTLDEGATVSCLEADSGKVVWRKDFSRELQSGWPQFHTSLSPLIVDGMCIVHVGGRGQGAVMALDLNSGEAKWKWEGEAPAYASPVLMTIDGTKQIVQQTERSVLGLGVSDGKLLWQVEFGGRGGGGRGGFGGPGGAGGGAGGGRGAGVGQAGQAGQPGPGGPGRGPGGPGGRRGPGGGGGGMSYNAATPIVHDEMVILSTPGAGTKALKIEKGAAGFAAKELWANPEVATQFNTAVIKDGRIYGISAGGNLFCLDAKTGETLWTGTETLGQQQRGRGFGSVVAAGPVLLALTPDSELMVFKPSEKEYEEIARIKVADAPTHAYPVVSGKRLFIKDRDSVMMYELE